MVSIMGTVLTCVCLSLVFNLRHKDHRTYLKWQKVIFSEILEHIKIFKWLFLGNYMWLTFQEYWLCAANYSKDFMCVSSLNPYINLVRYEIINPILIFFIGRKNLRSRNFKQFARNCVVPKEMQPKWWAGYVHGLDCGDVSQMRTYFQAHQVTHIKCVSLVYINLASIKWYLKLNKYNKSMWYILFFRIF